MSMSGDLQNMMLHTHQLSLINVTYGYMNLHCFCFSFYLTIGETGRYMYTAGKYSTNASGPSQACETDLLLVGSWASVDTLA